MLLSITFIILSFITSLFLLLCVPLRIGFEVRVNNSIESVIVLKWLYGLIHIRKFLSGEEKPKTFLKEQQRWPMERDFIKTLSLFLKALLKQTHIEKLIIDLKIGFKEPEYTGLFSGLSNALRPMVQWQPQYSIIRLEPNFQRSGIRGVVGASIRIIPLMYLALLCVFGLRFGLKKIQSKNLYFIQR